MAAESVEKKVYYEEVKGVPEPRTFVVREETDQKISLVRDAVLRTIRTHMPIETLFKPELKINLGVFISDQILFQSIADFLSTIPLGDVDPAAMAKQFENSALLDRLKGTFNPDLLPFFYMACADVLNGKALEDKMRGAIGGRIFTLKNALIAQQTPEAILKSQIQNGLCKQSREEIRKEGAAFIRQCLEVHLRMIKDETGAPFKQELRAVAEQLIPFVRQITWKFLQENIRYMRHCPDEPLIFRNPTGYNRHGLVAASVMEAALQVLGYNTRLMGRCDLEPKATLATAHNIIEVTGPDQVKYVVDPAYLQFHKDICISDEMLPKDPVLVLEEREVEDYIEKSIMPHWRSTFQRVEKGEQRVLEKLQQNDQLLAYLLDKIEGVSREIVPVNMEVWVKSALTRPWDLNSYQHILADRGFQEIFNGVEPDCHQTYDLVKGMGISALTSQRTYKEICARLDELMNGRKEKNSMEALSLFAQLPRNMRAKYSPLLDIDPRTEELDPCINAYFRSLAKVVNPLGQRFRVIYGCSGADATSILESTNANELFFVDLTEATFDHFKVALQHLQAQDAQSLKKEKEKLQQNSGFMSYRMRYSGAQSGFSNGKLFMTDLPMKLFLDLNSIGVDLTQIGLTKLGNGTLRMDFPWKYYGSPDAKMRSLTFIIADITNPDTYPPLLQGALREGIDGFFMKGAFFAPKQYPQFLPGIAKALKGSGWLMTADRSWLMDAIDPEECLRAANLNFSRVRTEESTCLTELMQPPFDPFGEIELLNRRRDLRNPGTDLFYWTILNLRKKMASDAVVPTSL